MTVQDPPAGKETRVSTKPVAAAASPSGDGRGRWDLVVLGGGTAGIVAARTAAGLGARVALVEGHRTGGDCLWTGCVPSKTLLAVARRAAAARSAPALGVEVGDVRVDFAAAMALVHAAIATIEPEDSPEALSEAGVTVISGWARLTADASVEVDGGLLTTRQVLLATGSSPQVPDLPGLRTAEPLTSETIWALSSRPQRMTVLGGGSIGCELGQAFARLGAQVTIVEQAPRLLPAEDPDASRLVEAALRQDHVDVRTGSRVTSVKGGRDGGTVYVGGSVDIPYDTLLVALGRQPRTARLGLSEAGVATDERGFITVDKTLRTSHRRVWAAGDLTGHPQYTHVAGVHGSIAASNAVLGLRRTVDTTAVPRVTYTDPEVAAVGVGTGEPAGRAGLQTVSRDHHDVDRAVVEGEVDGFSRMAVDGSGRILGATLVGPRAGETLPELVVAVRLGLRTRDLAGTIHAYPTYADGPWDAAIDDVRSRLAGPAARRVIPALLQIRRWWLDQ